MISKLSNWDVNGFNKSQHPEYVTIRNIVTNHKDHTFILVGEGTSYAHFRSDNVHFYNLKTDTKPSYALSFIIKFALSLLFKPSSIVSLGGRNIIPFGVSTFITRARFVPVITGEIWYDSQGIPSPLRNILTFALKITFRESYSILTLSTSIVNEIVHDFSVDPKKVHLYRYKISEIFNPSVTKRLKPSLNPVGPVVLTVCRISPEKGLDYLISASAIIVKSIPNVKIVIKGSSYKSSSPSVRKYEEELRQKIQELKLDERVMILEESPNSDIPEYLAAADVFVLPSLSEGMPLALMEAMATGLPVVATRVGGIPEILADGINGLMVNPRDPHALAGSIIAILSDSNLRRKLPTGALKTIEDIKENELEKLLDTLLFQD
jgi:glycosyltransferase involved in cell wall biosynthesis